MKRSRITDSQIFGTNECRGWDGGTASVPRAWDQHSDVLQMVLQVRVIDDAGEEVRGREPSPQEALYRSTDQTDIVTDTGFTKTL